MTKLRQRQAQASRICDGDWTTGNRATDSWRGHIVFMVLKYFEKLADVKPAKWRLSGGCLTIRWFIGRVLIGDKHILSGCTGYPDKRDKGTFGAGQNKIDPDKRYQRQNENGKPW